MRKSLLPTPSIIIYFFPYSFTVYLRFSPLCHMNEGVCLWGWEKCNVGIKIFLHTYIQFTQQYLQEKILFPTYNKVLTLSYMCEPVSVLYSSSGLSILDQSLRGNSKATMHSESWCLLVHVLQLCCCSYSSPLPPPGSWNLSYIFFLLCNSKYILESACPLYTHRAWWYFGGSTMQ